MSNPEKAAQFMAAMRGDTVYADVQSMLSLMRVFVKRVHVVEASFMKSIFTADHDRPHRFRRNHRFFKIQYPYILIYFAYILLL